MILTEIFLEDQWGLRNPAEAMKLSAEVRQRYPESAMVQDIQNRNDQQKQIQALTEQQNAEFEEATSNYMVTFQLLDQPVQFPTQ